MDALLYVSDDESPEFKTAIDEIPEAEKIQVKHLDGLAHEYVVYGFQLTTATINLIAAIVAMKSKSAKTHLKRGKHVLAAPQINEKSITELKEH
jgi:hypothetical protein